MLGDTMVEIAVDEWTQPTQGCSRGGHICGTQRKGFLEKVASVLSHLEFGGKKGQGIPNSENHLIMVPR